METYRKDLLPPEGLGFVGPAILEEGWSLVRSGHVTVHPGTGTMSGTVGEAGRMPVAVELRLPIGPNRPPRCAACGTVWCRHAVAVALRSWSRAADGEDRPAATKIFDIPAEPAPPPVAPHAWWANLSEADPGWFRLELGIVLEGRRVDLVPVFQQILRDKSLDILRAWILTGRPYPVRLPQGPVVGIAADRMIRICQVLETVLEGKGAPRLPRMEAVLLEDLGIEDWTVAPSLSGLRQRLGSLALPVPSEDPDGLAFPLREYQRQGVGWLRFLADLGFGGILADDMGLGKTIQTLAHLLEERSSGRLSDAALVVCPTSLVTNWMRETARLAPGLRAVAHHGPDRGAAALTPGVDMVVTSYPLLVRDATLLSGRRWSVAVFDEAHMLKNPSAQVAHAARRLPALRRLALTGTPLENHLGELWSILDLVAPGVLGNRARFRDAWRKPIEERGDQRKAAEMGRRIAPFLLRRTKFQVASELPSKTEIVQMLELPEPQRDVYEAVRARADRKVRDEIHRVGLEKSGAVVLEALLRLRQCCCDPRLLPEAVAGTAGPSAKLSWLLESLPPMLEEGRRVLLFSQFSSMLRLLSKELANLGIPHAFLTGDTVDRTAQVDRFQSGEVPVFLLSLKAGGSGLNLTAADTVILWDPWWNPAAEAQAVDRAHRIGQDRPVFVYRLLATATVEERVALLQEKKRNLVRGVVDGAPSAFHLSASELRDLLSS
jgi:superfamily II DNA or RNA helicase